MIFPFFIILLLGAVACILSLGALNMARQGHADRSQKLMRWRVGLQFIAILSLVGFFLWTRHYPPL
jgi:hypothetical protein